MESTITITQQCGQTFWLAIRCCQSHEEALAAKAQLDGMPWPAAYLPPETGAYMARKEAEEADLPEDMGLRAGGAYRCANGVGAGD